MTECLVYQVTNAINGKSYIGYTSKTLDERWRGHIKSSRKGSQFHFHAAIRKHGESAFIPSALFVEDTEAGAKETEILLILDRCPEYNKTMGGDGTAGHPVTAETREKIRNNTPVRRGSDHPMYGRKRPDMVERNKSRKGIKNPNMAKYGEDNHRYGKPNPNAIKAMRAALPEIVSDEAKSKMSAAAKKRAATIEGKNNSSLAGKKGAAVRWAKYRADKLANK